MSITQASDNSHDIFAPWHPFRDPVSCKQWRGAIEPILRDLRNAPRTDLTFETIDALEVMSGTLDCIQGGSVESSSLAELCESLLGHVVRLDTLKRKLAKKGKAKPRPLRPRKPVLPGKDGRVRFKLRWRYCVKCGRYGPHETHSDRPGSGDACVPCDPALREVLQ